MDFISVSRISKKQNNNWVVKDVSFTQQRFQKVAIAGETGSGKSTLLKMIAGLIQPDSGEVLFEQERVKGPEEKLMPGHPGIAYLSQHFELPNHYRVEEILDKANKMPPNVAGVIFEICRIDHLLKRKTDQLSGGEKQRIALAKLLISFPKLLLMDEPFSNLDMGHRLTFKSVLREITDKLQLTCILVSHDPLDILSWADKIIILKEGQMLQEGVPEQIYRQPENEYIAGLFGNYNLISPAQAKAYFQVQHVRMNGKNVLIRPEHIRIGVEENSGIPGRVYEVNFYGSFYEIEVLLSQTLVTIKTKECTVSKGDTVYVSLLDNSLWYV